MEKIDKSFLDITFFDKNNRWPAIIFTIIFLLSMLLGFLAIRQNLKTEDVFQDLQQHHLESLKLLTKAERAFWQLRFSLPNYAVDNMLEREAAELEFPFWYQSLNKHIGMYEQKITSLEERKLFSFFKENMSNYFKLRPRFFELVDKNRIKEALIYRNEFVRPLAKKTLDDLGLIIDYHHDQALIKEIELTAQLLKTRNLMVTFLLIELLLGFCLMKVLQASREKIDVVQQISNHNLKMAALGEMSGSIAHEINNPLALIQGKASQLLRHDREGSLDKKVLIESLEKIIGMSDRISKIIRGMKSISRTAEHDPFEKVELKIINDNIQGICSERFRNASINLEISNIPTLAIECRPSQIEQVIINLLNNAFDAVSPLSDKWVRLDFTNFHDKIQIAVTDSGEKISPEIVEKLMLPFFTTKEIGKGTGLGLSISKGIVEDHQGKMYFDSFSSHTRFVVELPINQIKS